MESLGEPGRNFGGDVLTTLDSSKLNVSQRLCLNNSIGTEYGIDIRAHTVALLLRTVTAAEDISSESPEL